MDLPVPFVAFVNTFWEGPSMMHTRICRLLILTALLLSLLPCAHAQTTRYETYPIETLPFGCPLRFVDGVHVDGTVSADFVLVDTIDFNGHYLEMRRGQDERCWGSIGGVQIPQGWTAQVDAQDADHCRLTLSSAEEKRTYDFRFRPLMDEGEWEMERYIIQRGGDRFEAYVPGLWRMEATETQNGQTRQARAAWYWANDCENLELDPLPRSIDEMRRLAQENPVAAIAPQDIRDRVNLREGPGTDHPRVGSLYSGVMMQILGDADAEWLHVNPLGGATQKAYVKRTLLAFGEDIWNVPNATQEMWLSSGGRQIPADEHPFHSNDPLGYLPPDIPVNVIGYYNDDWAIIGSWPGALYVEARYLKRTGQ